MGHNGVPSYAITTALLLGKVRSGTAHARRSDASNTLIQNPDRLGRGFGRFVLDRSLCPCHDTATFCSWLSLEPDLCLAPAFRGVC